MNRLNDEEVRMLFFVTGIAITSITVLSVLVLAIGVALLMFNETALHIILGIRLLIAFAQGMIIVCSGALGNIVRCMYLLHRDGYVDITIRKKK